MNDGALAVSCAAAKKRLPGFRMAANSRMACMRMRGFGSYTMSAYSDADTATPELGPLYGKNRDMSVTNDA